MSEEIRNSAIATTESFAPVTAMEMEGLMAEDLAGLDFVPDRIKIPAGGATTFEIPDGDEEDGVRTAKDITGVILLHHPAFAYYMRKYTGGSNPPDCGSFDGKLGVGNPGGSCATCPYNQFGSGEGKSKACKNRRILSQKSESEHVHAPVTAGARQIFLRCRFFLIILEKFYLFETTYVPASNSCAISMAFFN